MRSFLNNTASTGNYQSLDIFACEIFGYLFEKGVGLGASLNHPLSVSDISFVIVEVTEKMFDEVILLWLREYCDRYGFQLTYRKAEAEEGFGVDVPVRISQLRGT